MCCKDCEDIYEGCHEDCEDIKNFTIQPRVKVQPSTPYERLYFKIFGEYAFEMNIAAQKEYRARLDLKKPTTILESIKVGWVMVREEIKDAIEERRSNY